MIIKVLGAADFLTGMVLIALHFDVIGKRIALIFAAYLLLKAFAFVKDFASIFDIAAAIYIVLLMFGIGHVFFTVIFVIYLVQKGIVSFL